MSTLTRAPIAVALDAPDIDTARRWAGLVGSQVTTLKIGLELYLRYGPDVVAAVRDGTHLAGSAEPGVFLDLKLHDIPTTVAGAARSVAHLRPSLLTVHASGGGDMVAAAVQAAPETTIAAVTVLTSLGEPELGAIGMSGPSLDATRRLSALAVAAGAGAIVCSPREVAAVRAEVGPDVTLVTPGVRPAGVQAGDHAYVATPAAALADGADLLVLGRAVTRASAPASAVASIVDELPGAVGER